MKYIYRGRKESLIQIEAEEKQNEMEKIVTGLWMAKEEWNYERCRQLKMGIIAKRSQACMNKVDCWAETHPQNNKKIYH